MTTLQWLFKTLTMDSKIKKEITTIIQHGHIYLFKMARHKLFYSTYCTFYY